jgi:adenine/guanine phosphoribosyltransferase-like PRPP-binding protein
MTTGASTHWVTDRLGVRLETTAGDSGDGLQFADLVGLAVRDNPRRAHLLVSRVLGKHVPTDPRLVYGAGRLLGARVADALTGADSGVAARGGQILAAALRTGRPDFARELLARSEDQLSRPDPSTVVLGFAETATGLGHAVADSLAAPYLHSTRRSVAGAVAMGGFEEEHSHATAHQLLPDDPTLFEQASAIVLVDDEISTGQTVLNTIRLFNAANPRCARYFVATLVDTRSKADQDRMAEMAAELMISITVVSLIAGRIELPTDVIERGRALVAEYASDGPVRPRVETYGVVVRLEPSWPVGVREGARHGFAPSERARLEAAARQCAEELSDHLAEPLGRGNAGLPRILVLGCEELMYAPLRIAIELTQRYDGLASVLYSTTTRSPVLAIDDEGYAIRSKLAFPAHDDPGDGSSMRYAYNVLPAGTGQEPRFNAVVLVVDEPGDSAELSAPGGLLSQLTAAADRVYLVTVPVMRPAPVPARRVAAGRSAPARSRPLTGPEFGSYRPTDVSWLLTDLSDVALERPTEEREEAIQSGVAHYAESLPIEYQPDREYQALFDQALRDSSTAVAAAVGVVTELVLARRGRAAVLASLARAGTPIGILMKRWALFAHGLELPHYTISIVRGRGIDQVALRYLAEQHRPEDVQFVDGWTGKGAIMRELTAAVESSEVVRRAGRFSPALAVLADPGSCATIFGTRADYLIPSACLNSTVSGLVSRTVVNEAYIGAGQFHGAKFYSGLRAADVSNVFLDAITAQFSTVHGEVGERTAAMTDGRIDLAPTWAGWRTVETLARRYGIGNLDLIKPGVGETTRVLLRRVPWKVLMRTDAAADLSHVVLLAKQRDVPVEFVDDLAYRCVGLIRSGYPSGNGARPEAESA